MKRFEPLRGSARANLHIVCFRAHEPCLKLRRSKCAWSPRPPASSQCTARHPTRPVRERARTQLAPPTSTLHACAGVGVDALSSHRNASHRRNRNRSLDAAASVSRQRLLQGLGCVTRRALLADPLSSLVLPCAERWSARSEPYAFA